jgi:hypothetical protein
MKNKILAVIFALMAVVGFSQEKKDAPLFGISFSGFVKTDLYYDARQTVNIREGHFLLYPDNEKLDVNGMDVNANGQLGILAIQSRLSGKITGPDVLKAKTSALLEGDFFGNENGNFSDVNGFRLRHAILKLNWASSELLVGQFWHPLFVHDCFPDVVSFNTGAPFQPFSRNPQIRFTQKFGGLKLVAAAAEQRDFTSNGPDGANNKYLRNSVLPDLNFHLQYLLPLGENKDLFMGVGVEYKQLTPQLFAVADKNLTDKKDSIYVASTEKVSSFAIAGYAKLRLKSVTLKSYAIYGGNLFDLVMLGGYATGSLVDASQNRYDYMPIRTFSCWSEFSTNGKIQFGVFGGFSKNLGTDGVNGGKYYSRGSNIDFVYRVSPRMVFNLEKLRISAEMEYTTANYGKANTMGEVVDNLKAQSNIRALLAFYYFF